MKILLVGNGSRKNRGCEAITISTIEFLKHHIPGVEIEVLSFYVDVDKYFESYGVTVSNLTSAYPRKKYIHFMFKVLRRLGLLPISTVGKFFMLTPYEDKLTSSDIVLSLGGDNYTDDYGGCDLFWTLALLSEKHRKPFVIWGGSVGAFTRKKNLKKAKRGLSAISLVTAREDHTVRYLKSIGYKGKIVRVYDSAFGLGVQRNTLPDFSRKTKIVGFNISPLYYKYTSKTSEEILLIAKEFIREISERYNVLLIPHVVKDRIGENDAIYMESIVEGLDNVRPVNPAFNSMELKYAISQCDYFVGARTHATIAAYSSGVPTLALAYSLKARGLNEDLFGSDEFLLDAKDFNLENLIKKFDHLVKHHSRAEGCLSEKRKVFTQMIETGVKSLRMFI